MLQNCNVAKTYLRYSTLTITVGCKTSANLVLHIKEVFLI